MLTSFTVVIARGGRSVPPGNWLYQLFLILQIAAFFIGFWSSTGQTLGKRAWGIRVETDRGEIPPLAVATCRFVSALISGAALGLGFLWMLADPQGRTWHDRVSSTRVVRLRN